MLYCPYALHAQSVLHLKLCSVYSKMNLLFCILKAFQIFRMNPSDESRFKVKVLAQWPALMSGSLEGSLTSRLLLILWI